MKDPALLMALREVNLVLLPLIVPVCPCLRAPGPGRVWVMPV